MRKILFLILATCAACWSCSDGPVPEERAARAAKVYYDWLIQGKYEDFVDGRYQPEAIPPAYRQQLIANAKMFVGDQQAAHKGLKEVRVATATVDTARHVANVFLIFVYGDSTTEEVLVPMIENKDVWYMR